MMTKNILVMCSIIAFLLALLFIISAVGLLISIIVSKVHNNNVRSIRIILMIALVVCGILSCAGYSSLHSQLINSLYDGVEKFSDVYNEKTNVITVNGNTYICTPASPDDMYDYENDEYDAELIGTYILEYEDEYTDTVVDKIFGLFLYSQSLESEDYINVSLYKYEDDGYDLIFDDYNYSVYCSEEQYADYLKHLCECASVSWNAYNYSGDNYFDRSGAVTDITDDIKSVLYELAEASSYTSNDSGLVKSLIGDEGINVDINLERESGESNIYYSLYYFNEAFYSCVDYEWDGSADDEYYICYKLADKSQETLRGIVQLPDGTN